MERNQIRFNMCIETCINRPPISISPPCFSPHAFPLLPMIRKQIVSLPTEVQLANFVVYNTKQTMECLNIGKMVILYLCTSLSIITYSSIHDLKLMNSERVNIFKVTFSKSYSILIFNSKVNQL